MRDIIMHAVGFLLAALMIPIGMTVVAATNSTFGVTGVAATYASVYTIFTVLLPILAMIGIALHFIVAARK